MTIEPCHHAEPVIALHANNDHLLLGALSLVDLSEFDGVLEHSMIGQRVCVLDSLLVDVQLEWSWMLKVTLLASYAIEDVSFGDVVEAWVLREMNADHGSRFP